MGVASLNSNIASLSVQRRLGETTSRLQSSFARLSTGLRINRASDDAAGLAIADNLRVDSRLQSQAIRNVNDGISLLNIMSGTLEQQQDIVIRLRELAEQAANGALSTTQRSALNEEYQSLVSEFGRLGDSTRFNGVDLLRGARDGGAASILLQAGITGSTLAQLGISRSDTGQLSGYYNASEDGSFFGFPGSLQDSLLFSEIDAQVNHKILTASVVDETGRTRDLLIIFSNATSAAGTDSYSAKVYQRVSDTGGVGSQSGAGGQGDVTSASDEWVYGGTGGVAVSQATRMVNDDGVLNVALLFDGATVRGDLALDMRGLTFNVTGTDDSTTVLEATGVETSARALDALMVLQGRQTQLSQIQGEVGAVGSRLETALNTLSVARENTSAAESAIRDVDVAEESSTLLASQIRQQSASQILSLANSQGSLLLGLITGSG